MAEVPEMIVKVRFEDDLPEICELCGARRGDPEVKCWGDNLPSASGTTYGLLAKERTS